MNKFAVGSGAWSGSLVSAGLCGAGTAQGLGQDRLKAYLLPCLLVDTGVGVS